MTIKIYTKGCHYKYITWSTTLLCKAERWTLHFVFARHYHLHLLMCLLPTDSLISRIMCYGYTILLLPGQLRQTRQDDLSVTFHTQSVSRWRHNECSCCSHPSCTYSLAHTCCQGQTWCSKMNRTGQSRWDLLLWKYTSAWKAICYFNFLLGRYILMSVCVYPVYRIHQQSENVIR